jgi:hypothetical protein
VNDVSPLRRSLLRLCVRLATIALSCLAFAQVFNKELEIRVHGLPKLMARAKDPADVLLTALHTILNDPQICCTPDSVLGDSAGDADPTSLKDLASKLKGKHTLSDGRTAVVTAEYLTPENINAGLLIKMITDQHAALLEWNSHVYVLDGVTYVWIASGGDSGTSATTAIRKFLLIDTRYSDARRRAEFNRDTDDLSKIQGLLFVDVKLQ